MTATDSLGLFQLSTQLEFEETNTAELTGTMIGKHDKTVWMEKAENDGRCDPRAPAGQVRTNGKVLRGLAKSLTRTLGKMRAWKADQIFLRAGSVNGSMRTFSRAPHVVLELPRRFPLRPPENGCMSWGSMWWQKRKEHLWMGTSDRMLLSTARCFYNEWLDWAV